MHFIKKYWFVVLFVAIGALGGYLYWFYIGCESGSCPITSIWYHNTAYGALLGYLIGDTVKGRKKKAVDME